MKQTQRGFTLIEILVALSVASLLLSLVYGAVRVGQRGVFALDKQTAQTEIMRIGWQFLHNAIAHAIPTIDPQLDDNSENRTGFEGTPDSMVFVADMPTYVGIGGLMRIRLGKHDSDDGQQLLLSRERLEQEESSSPDEPEQAVLVDQLDLLQIEYFGQIERGSSPTWSTYWDSPRNLPNLVRITIKPTQAAAWPVLIARPLTGTTAIDESAVPDEGMEPDPDTEAME